MPDAFRALSKAIAVPVKITPVARDSALDQKFLGNFKAQMDP